MRKGTSEAPDARKKITPPATRGGAATEDRSKGVEAETSGGPLERDTGNIKKGAQAKKIS